MWSLFSRDPTKDFAYEIGEIVPGLDDKSIWTLHEGKRKSNGDEVSVFAFDVKANSESQVEVAKASMKRLKTLRHPNIVTFLDGLETDKVLYIATEKVIPLETHLREFDVSSKNAKQQLAISWGLHQLLNGLSFLVNDCRLIHNNVCLASVFVDRAGEWKLGGVDYMYSSQGDNAIPPVKVLAALERYDPPEKAGSSGRRPPNGWASDMWGLGVLIWEVFNGTLPNKSSLKSLGKMPKHFIPNYCELVSANPKSRPNPKQFKESCTSSGGFMDNDFVKAMVFLEEIQIKDQVEKTKFFHTLPASLDSFPESFCKHKILPQLVHAFEFGNAGSAVLAPLFKLGKLLDTAEYQQKIVPCVVKLFSSTDRATRVKLLQQVEHFVEHLTPDVVNNQLFPNIVQGFTDSNPVVREHTIKSMIHLAPKLNYKNLNEELLKQFARLQSKDDQGGIRTNTTVCLGKIGSYLNPQMRQKVLVSAYLRAMKDPFPPARQAGILAMAASHNYFTLAESAHRLIPALASLSVDPDKSVRDQAFKAIKCFLVKLEKVSDTPELQEDMEKDVLSGSAGPGGGSSWAGWAVSGMSSLTSRLVRPRGPTDTQNARAPSTTSKNSAATDVSSPKPTTNVVSRNEPELEEATDEDENPADGGGWDDEDQGWSDDWGDMENTQGVSHAKVSAEVDTVEDEDGGGWEDDWGSLEETDAPASAQSSLAYHEPESPWGAKDFTPISDSHTSPANAYDWGDANTGDDFFSSVISDLDKKKKPQSRSTSASLQSSRSGSKSPDTISTTMASSGSASKPSSLSTSSSSKPASTRTSQKEPSASGGGWEDSGWGDAWDDSSADTGLSEADLAKQRREEKRLQRQREMEEKRAARKAGGGAMKLGGKKLAKD